MPNSSTVFDRQKKYIKRFSTAEIWITECQNDGTIPSDAEWTLLPYITAPKIKTNEDSSELRDGSNAVIYKSNELTSYELNFEMLQADKNTIEMPQKARNRFFALVYKVGVIGKDISSPGVTQYQIFSPGQISGANETDYGDFVKVTFTYTTLKNDVDVSLTNLPDNVTTPEVIAKDEQRAIIEVPITNTPSTPSTPEEPEE